MQFNFDSKIAEKFGLNEAVFIHNIFFWINHNKVNNRNQYEGRFWTYNTKRAFVKQFPFWTYEQMKKIIDNLNKSGVLLMSNFNENKWDKTIWYSLSDEVMDYYENLLKPNENALLQKQQSSVEKTTIECVNNNNRVLQSQHSLIGTDNKTHIENQIEGSLAFFQNNFPSAYEALMMQFKSKIKDFQKFQILFDAKVETEKLEYDERVLRGRFISFATNWIENENKESKVIELNNGPKQRIGGF
jgi:hypothetical protein